MSIFFLSSYKWLKDVTVHIQYFNMNLFLPFFLAFAKLFMNISFFFKVFFLSFFLFVNFLFLSSDFFKNSRSFLVSFFYLYRVIFCFFFLQMSKHKLHFQNYSLIFLPLFLSFFFKKKNRYCELLQLLYCS